MNRSWVVLGAVLIQLCLGAIYAWSVFTPCLLAEPYGFSATQTQIIFGVGLATFALVMIFSGWLQKKVSPRALTRIGGVTLGAGYVVAGMVGDSFYGLLIAIGVIAGAGIGLAYAIPIAVGVKWFPDRKGLLTGLAVAGFGFGALIWVKLAGSWGHLIDEIGLANTFVTYGIVFAALVFLGSSWMINPPVGYCPAGWSPERTGGVTVAQTEMDARMMRHTWQFYALWTMFVAGAMAGLMVIGCMKLFGIDALQQGGFTAVAASAKAGTAMAVFFALANGLGRIGWGVVSDRWGRKRSLATMFFLQALAMLLFYATGSAEVMLYACAALIGFNFGGNFALFPAITADYFGNKNVGSNYAWVFTAYGVGGIVGPILGGYFKNQATEGDPTVWFMPMVIASLGCLAAGAIALLLKPPRTELVYAVKEPIPPAESYVSRRLPQDQLTEQPSRVPHTLSPRR